MSQFRFLFKQVVKARKNLVLLLIGFLIISGVYFYNKQQILNVRQYHQINLRMLEYAVEDLSEDTTICIENLKQKVDLSKRILSEEDMNLIYDCSIRSINLDLEEGIGNKPKLLMEKEYLRHLKTNQLEYDSYTHPISAISFTYWIMTDHLVFLVILSLIFILSRQFTFKYKNQVNIFKFISPKKNNFHLEIVLGVVMGLMILFIMMLFSFILSYYFEGLGSFLYPFLIEDEFIMIAQLIGPSFIVIFVLIMIVVIILYVLAMVFKDRNKVLMVALGLFLVALNIL
ncbi:MAG TPA: hypothetical protein GX703_02075 [Erysipelothrix sp.]|nr:hypothetical protein [Erysipelothrix sp.]